MRAIGFHRLIVLVNVPELPRSLADDSGGFVSPSDLPTQAPAYVGSKSDESLDCAVVAKNRSAGPHLAILRDSRNGTASSIRSDDVRRQTDLAEFDRPIIM